MWKSFFIVCCENKSLVLIALVQNHSLDEQAEIGKEEKSHEDGYHTSCECPVLGAFVVEAEADRVAEEVEVPDELVLAIDTVSLL